MPVILNETVQAKCIIENGNVGTKPTSTLFLLGKYYRQKEHLTKEQTIVKLDGFMKKNYKNYNAATWENTIEDIVKKANKYPLKDIDCIWIKKNELDTIYNIHSIKYEKLVFTMLCYAKFYNAVSENNNGWVNADISEIYNVARVTVKHKQDKFLYLNDLESIGVISFSNKNDNLNLRVNFIDTESENVLRIDDFRELGYEYLKIATKDKFINCQSCNRLIRKKNNRQKYCTECYKRINSSMTNKRQKYKREFFLENPRKP